MKFNRNQIKLNLLQRQSVKTRQTIVIASASFAFLFVFALIVYFNFSNRHEAYAATGDYRTKATGNWNSISIWERYNGSNWVAASASPSNTDNAIAIRNGHTVTVTANATVDQVDINSGGQLILNSGITLTLANGTGTDFSVTGTFKNAGTVMYAASATMAFQSGGIYQHTHTTTAGTIPTATWNSGSTCEVTGYTSNSSAPSGINQSFRNFTWNCPSQSSDIALGSFTTVNGNFTVTSTGSKELRLSTANITLNVGGDYIQSGGYLMMSTASNAVCTLAVSGNYNQSGGTFEVIDGSSASAVINLSGNWSHTGGTLTTGNGTATCYFKKSGTQTFSASGNTVSGNVDFIVNSGSTLSMGSNILLGRNFTLSSGAGIQIGSPNGITSLGSSGNIQTTLLRSFNSGANYTYNGTSSQVTGNALPSTVNNLTLNNNSGLTLSSTTSVSNVLTLTTGKITTGAMNELRTTSTSSSAIQSHSSSDYVIGNLRRSVSSSGTYDFPLGTSSNYELITVALSGTSGFSTLLGTFTNSNPVTISLPLSGIILDGFNISRMLDYGYWTLTPNLLMLGGSYSVTMHHTGSNVSPPGRRYCVLKRNSVLSAWQSLGTHDQSLQKVNGNTVTTVRSGLTSFSDFGVGFAEYYCFTGAKLISGTDGQPGSVYLFENIKDGLDAWIEIISLDNGAQLADVDQFDGGYDEAWQPLVESNAGDTSSITWKITFKVGGTSTDTTLASMSITAVDVDGGDKIKEFVDGPQIYSYATDATCNLEINNNSGYYQAMGAFITVDKIDTNERQAMFQINYTNVSSFTYRTGSISIDDDSEVRQFSLYFNPFFSGNQALPVELMYFKAKLSGNEVFLNWATAAEKNNDYFTVERSSDGKNFAAIATVKGAGNSTSMSKYSHIDKYPLAGVSYYRLRQTDYDGAFEIFNIEVIKTTAASAATTGFEIKSAYPNPFSSRFSVKVQSEELASAELQLLRQDGTILRREQVELTEGESEYGFSNLDEISPGVYIVRILSDAKISKSVTVIKR